MVCNFASKSAFMSTISSFSLIVSSLFDLISRSRSSLLQTVTAISGFLDLNFVSGFFFHFGFRGGLHELDVLVFGAESGI